MSPNGGGSHSLVHPLRNQSKDPGKHLQSCKHAKTQSTELIDTTLETEAKLQVRVRMDGNLEVGIIEVNREHPVSLPDRPQDRRHRLHPELRQCHEAIEGRQIYNGPPAPSRLHKEKAIVEARTWLVDNLQSPFLEHLLDFLLKSKSAS